MLTRLALAMALVGCATDIDVDVDTGSTEQAIRQCPEDFCGANSPTIAAYGFYNFNTDGYTVNNAGFRLMGMSLGNEWFDLVVRDSAIIGRSRRGDISGSKLVGATIWIAQGRRQYGIVIDDVGTANEVVGRGEPIEDYLLNYSAVIANPLPYLIRGGTIREAPVVSGKKDAVCPYPPDPYLNGRIEWDESVSPLAHMSPYQTLVYEGDVIYADSRTVDPKVDDHWFNIACAAHTLAKLRLTRNTIKLTPWENVQSALKALSADYCGTGNGWTIPGQPLVWTEGAVAMPYWNTPRGLEARWDETGALCLDEPRVLNSAYAAGQFPSTVHSDILDECANAASPRKLQPCNNPDPYSTEFPTEKLTTGLFN